MYFNFDWNYNMTFSSAANKFQTIYTQIWPDILSGPDRGPNCMTL